MTIIELDEYGEAEYSTGICSSCGQECQVETHDDGIGWYEYGDQRCKDVQLFAASKCCLVDAYKIEDKDE
jgi:hypothetical protein